MTNDLTQISFCTVAMNRLDHVTQTLLKNIAENEDHPRSEFVLLDYGSRDGLEDWVHRTASHHVASGKLVYLRLNTAQYFNHSHSRNVCFLASSGTILCNVDADNYLPRGFAWYLEELVSGHPRCIAAFIKPPRQCNARLCMRRDDFLRIGGYDEAFQGWGFEDKDLRDRLIASGCKKLPMDTRFAGFVPHGDARRVEHMPPDWRNKRESNRRNRELSLHNRIQNELVANLGHGWGKATLCRNFMLQLAVGSELLNHRR